MPGTKKKTQTRTLASSSDRHILYQRAVQCVEAEIDFVDRVYTRLRNEKASLLREDFCGTANTSCEWVRRRPTNIAVGLDIDPAPMAWGRKHNLSTLTDEQLARLHLQQGDVLTSGPYRAPHVGPHGRKRGFDAVLAMNFSYWCFKERATLLRYFRAVYNSLQPRGIFFLDFYGGSDALKVMEEPRKIPADGKLPPFTYIWDQYSYDPISGELKCYIHFRFNDGSEIKRAFQYEWRLWTIPEIRDILADAGFSKTTVYWEGDDGKGGGNGIFRASAHGEACPAFVSYVVVER